MNENLPPPHWSPTGNSGTWYWENEWKWADDVHPLDSVPASRRRREWYEKLLPSFLQELIKKFIKKTER